MMERLLRLAKGRNLSALGRYGIAVLVVLAVAALRAALPVLTLPFLFFIPAMMGVAFALGRGPGLFGTVLSVLIAAFLFVEPAFSLALSTESWVAAALFGVITCGIVVVCDALGASLLQRDTHIADLAASRAALAESDAFLRSVLSASPDCIKVLDLDARLMFMSEGGYAVMEVSDFNAIKGCPWPDFWQGEGRDKAMAAVMTARAGGRGHFRGPAATMLGNRRYWDVLVTPIFGPDGQPEKLLSVSRDTTDTWEVEEALRASEAYWRGLFERLTEGFIVGEVLRDQSGKITDWRYVDVNAAWGGLVGIDPSKAIGHTIREVFPGIEDAWVNEFADVVRTGQPIGFTRQVGSLDRWYEGRAFPLGGERFGVLFLEVSDRVLADKRRDALLELGDRLRDLDQVSALGQTAAEIMARVTGASRAGYGVVDPARETVDVQTDWCAPGHASVSGVHSSRTFGSYIEDLKQGEVVAIEDVASDPRTHVTAQALLAIGVKVLLNIPIMERGQIAGIAFVHYADPHVFSAEELAFIRSVGDRVQTAVAQLQAEERQRILNHELSHRLKNTLAMVLSIATQTLRSVPDQGPVETFEKRVLALSSAHDILLRQDWVSAPLAAVAETVLGNFAQEDRFDVAGPEIALGARAALSTALLLHELGTNAAKYGALSGELGRVAVKWRLQGEGDGQELVLDWSESGGPPVMPPSRRGFGSRLIRMGLVGTGGVTIDYPATGLHASMCAPVLQLTQA